MKKKQLKQVNRGAEIAWLVLFVICIIFLLMLTARKGNVGMVIQDIKWWFGQ
ncbi:hypothetical protein J4464_06540 [Candidatus Woesearchaeota archaeon]|nr:hypothetical protein [Candidatus Woesearchaeota archaeon]